MKRTKARRIGPSLSFVQRCTIRAFGVAVRFSQACRGNSLTISAQEFVG
jgi:hypothetical protein